MTTHVIFCISPIHGHCTLMYLGLLYLLAVICRALSLYCTDWMAGSSTWFFTLHFSDGLIMYFSHRITPLTSHIRGHLLQLILPHMVDHTFMAFTVPLQTLYTPWTIFGTFDVSKIIPKNMHYFLYATFKPIVMYIRGFDP